MLARTVVISVLASLAMAAAGCSAESGGSTDAPADSEASGICGAADGWKNRCSSASACDATIASTCSDVTSLLNPSILAGAEACLRQSSCGSSPVACLAKSIPSAKPTDAHTKLAEAYCDCLVTGADTCKASLEDGAAKAALTIALPLSDDLAGAITEACTGSLGCSATFSACAQGVIAKKLAENLSPDAAKCLAESVLDAKKGGSSDGSCAAKTCEDFGGACGDHDDGCGGKVNCGTCAGTCKPKTCQELGKTCGTAPDGCNGTVNCGKCETACTADAKEPNDDQGAATSLGNLSDSPDSTISVDSLALSDGDEDWFVANVSDDGFDGNPHIEVTVTGQQEIAIFYVCTNGGDASYCPDGATQDNTIGRGCRGTHDVALKTSCDGITDSGKAYIRVRKTASDGQCASYSLTTIVQ